jgi:stress response protein SCP2
MAISLIKGQKIDLYKLDQGLKSIAMYLSLNTPANNFFGAVLLTDISGRVRNTRDFLYYDNLSNSDQSVFFTSENNRRVNVHLDKVSPLVQKIILGLAAKKTSNKIPSLTFKLCNLENGKDIAYFSISEESGDTALVIAELYRHNESWKLSAIGSGFAGGFEALCASYGVEIKNSIFSSKKEELAILKHFARIDTFINNRQKNEYEKNQMSMGIVDTSIFGR